MKITYKDELEPITITIDLDSNNPLNNDLAESVYLILTEQLKRTKRNED